VRSKLQTNETVALIVRKHWLVLAKPTLMVTAVLIYYLTRNSLMGMRTFLDSFAPFALVFALGWLLYNCLDRMTNIWAVTNFRLIDEWGIVTNNSKENTLDKINDITVEQTITGRMLNYGTVSVQTAATEGETVIRFVEKPQLLKSVMSQQRELWVKPELATKTDHREDVDRILRVPAGIVPPFAIGCPHCGGGVVIEYERPRYFAEHSPETSGHESKETDRPAVNGRGWKRVSPEETL
jgi:hypothetical protein